MERPEMFDVESCNELGSRLQGLSVAAEPSRRSYCRTRRTTP
jgi:hypothetical protein